MKIEKLEVSRLSSVCFWSAHVLSACVAESKQETEISKIESERERGGPSRVREYRVCPDS